MCSASQSPPRIWGAVISNLLLVLCRSCLTLKIFLLPRFRFRLGPRADRQHVQKKKKINEKEMRSIFYPFTAAHFLFLWIEGGGGSRTGRGRELFSRCNRKRKMKKTNCSAASKPVWFQKRRRIRGLHFSEEQRPVGASGAETFRNTRDTFQIFAGFIFWALNGENKPHAPSSQG